MGKLAFALKKPTDALVSALDVRAVLDAE